MRACVRAVRCGAGLADNVTSYVPTGLEVGYFSVYFKCNVSSHAVGAFLREKKEREKRERCSERVGYFHPSLQLFTVLPVELKRRRSKSFNHEADRLETKIKKTL